MVDVLLSPVTLFLLSSHFPAVCVVIVARYTDAQGLGCVALVCVAVRNLLADLSLHLHLLLPVSTGSTAIVNLTGLGEVAQKFELTHGRAESKVRNVNEQAD